MSGSLIAAGSQAINVLFRARRAIGMIVPDVVLSELSHDELTITQHPVEQGAPISDHAFKQPATLFMRCGWSNSRPAGFRAPAGFLLQNQTFVIQVYQALLDLQAKREPFEIFTGKRFYTSMLIASLDIETDAKTEHALFVTARFQEVIIVSTQAVQVAPNSSQAQPSTTGGTQSTGPTTANPVGTSVAPSGPGLFGIGGGREGGSALWYP